MIIKEDQFIFINDDGKKSIFYRREYYKHVSDIIKTFFNESLSDNEFHKRFISLLNELEDYNDVYNITTEMPFYWAICIIENDWTTNHLIKDKTLDDYIQYSKKYDKKNNITTFIIEDE